MPTKHIIECTKCRKQQKINCPNREILTVASSRVRVPYGWHTVFRGESNLAKHFCGDECLVKYHSNNDEDGE